MPLVWIIELLAVNSVHKWESILEIYNDAHTFGMKSSNSKAVSNSNLAISWLEATFPGLAHQAGEGGNLFAIKAQPYVLFDASISLQVFFNISIWTFFIEIINYVCF